MLTITALKKKYGVHTTKNHEGKMLGLSSISTSSLCNANCIKRSNIPGTICSKCYANSLQEYRTNMADCFKRNTEVLTTVIIPEEDLPILFSETGLFRFEAFGDLNNEIQVVNYFNMARANPSVKFALWTKNPWIIQSAIEKYGLVKPGNLQIIGSSYYINKPMKEFFERYDFIDNIFTVYDKNYIKENNVNITCGSRSCATCQKCYLGTHEEYEIREKLK